MPLELNHDQIATKDGDPVYRSRSADDDSADAGEHQWLRSAVRIVHNRNEAPPMTADLPDHVLELRSLVTSQGTLELSLHHVPVPSPAANEVLVRVEASPINPSDLALLIAGADITTAKVSGTPERPIVTASLGAGVLGGLSARVDKSLTVGNEGAGTVVAAGPSSAAQALLGKTVGICRRCDVHAIPIG
jgi:hypothetical protein